MLFNRPMTIYRKSVTPDGIKWDRIITSRGYIYVKFGQKSGKDRDDESTRIYARILTDESICKVGDRVVTGVSPFAIPPDNSYVIEELTENFTGSKQMHHVRMILA